MCNRRPHEHCNSTHNACYQNPLSHNVLPCFCFCFGGLNHAGSSASTALTERGRRRIRVQCGAMSFIRDIRLALRLFRQTPAITAIALISIALTVAATSVVYTAIKAVLIDPLPYTQPERLVQFRTDLPFLPNYGRVQTDFAFCRDAH